jgi:hypothetical protein
MICLCEGYMSMTFCVAISPVLASFTSPCAAFLLIRGIHVGTIQWLILFLLVGHTNARHMLIGFWSRKVYKESFMVKLNKLIFVP